MAVVGLCRSIRDEPAHLGIYNIGVYTYISARIIDRDYTHQSEKITNRIHRKLCLILDLSCRRTRG